LRVHPTRPHTPLLDRDRIADAALKLTDRRGDFTILDLSRALKVTPAALYHHVDGRDGIIALMRERIARAVDASAFGQLLWDEAMRRWAVSYRETFAAHPGTIGMLAAEPVADPAVHAMYEQAATTLEDAGFPRHRVLAVITAVESFILGSALDLAAPPVMVSGIDAGATPRLAGAAAAAPAGRARADQAFCVGLDALIAGLRCTLTQAGDH
jgi:AcrR family transcriptional regulator